MSTGCTRKKPLFDNTFVQGRSDKSGMFLVGKTCAPLQSSLVLRDVGHLGRVVRVGLGVPEGHLRRGSYLYRGFYAVIVTVKSGLK